MIKKQFSRPRIKPPAFVPRTTEGRPAIAPRTAPGPSTRQGGRPAPHGRPPFRRTGQGTARPEPARHEKLERDNNAVSFVPLGGLEEIGRNCSFFEYKNEILIVDVGIQFPEESTPGVDYIIPNIEYLKAKKDNIHGIVLTHGHYDHIAAIHYLIEQLGNPIIYTAPFTKAMVEKRHEEFTNAPRLRFHVIRPGDKVRISDHFSAEFFEVEHTIPEAFGFILDTPVGNMVSFGDFRLDYDAKGKPRDLDVFEKIGARGIHSVFIDSTNADLAGTGVSEETVKENLDKLISGAKGRVIVACFASLVDRVLEIIKIADRLGRKVAVNGRSMKTNLDIAKNLGYFKEKGDVIPLEEVNKHRDDKVLILTTGAQGESNAGLMRIVNGEHRVVHLKPTDTVIFSSSVIPGNERSVQSLQDSIARQVDEVYNSKLLDIHVSGHANGEDVAMVIKLIKPRFVVPIHAYFFKRKAVVKAAVSVGMKRENVIMMDNGQVASLTKDAFVITEEKVPAFYVMVDGLGVGDVEEVVLRDRRNLAQEGMVVIIVTVDKEHGGKLLKNPDIISRGFIYLKENQEILDEIRKRIRGLVGRLPAYQPAEADYIKTLIRDQIGHFIYNKTKRRPMILPVVVEI